MKYVFTFTALVGLSACTGGSFPMSGLQNADPAVVAPVAPAAPDLSPSRGPQFAPPVRPTLDVTQTRPDLPPPPSANARTVEEFDTTTAADRAAAVVAPTTSGARRLGTTIASLGSPTDPGIWFKTPLVKEIIQGRVDYNGTSVNVELRPSGGAAGSGSQISLAAMRLIGAPLTGLPEVTVYAN